MNVAYCCEFHILLLCASYRVLFGFVITESNINVVNHVKNIKKFVRKTDFKQYYINVFLSLEKPLVFTELC